MGSKRTTQMRGRPASAQQLKVRAGASRGRGESCWEQNSSSRKASVGLRTIFEPSFTLNGRRPQEMDDFSTTFSFATQEATLSKLWTLETTSYIEISLIQAPKESMSRPCLLYVSVLNSCQILLVPSAPIGTKSPATEALKACAREAHFDTRLRLRRRWRLYMWPL